MKLTFPAERQKKILELTEMTPFGDKESFIRQAISELKSIPKWNLFVDKYWLRDLEHEIPVVYEPSESSSYPESASKILFPVLNGLKWMHQNCIKIKISALEIQNYMCRFKRYKHSYADSCILLLEGEIRDCRMNKEPKILTAKSDSKRFTPDILWNFGRACNEILFQQAKFFRKMKSSGLPDERLVRTATTKDNIEKIKGYLKEADPQLTLLDEEAEDLATSLEDHIKSLLHKFATIHGINNKEKSQTIFEMFGLAIQTSYYDFPNRTSSDDMRSHSLLKARQIEDIITSSYPDP